MGEENGYPFRHLEKLWPVGGEAHVDCTFFLFQNLLQGNFQVVLCPLQMNSILIRMGRSLCGVGGTGEL